MKKLLISILLAGISASANASIYTCRDAKTQSNAESKNVYLLVFDRVQHRLSIFTQFYGTTVPDSWSLMHADAYIAYPMQPGTEYAASVIAQDASTIDWSVVDPQTCFVSKKDNVNLQLKDTNGYEIKGVISTTPNVVRNPNKSQQDCPTPMPFVPKPMQITCTKM